MSDKKENTRLEAFSDGVFAIAITLLILEIKVPNLEKVHSVDDLWHALSHLWPSYFAFIFSFGTILVSWVNHHHVFNIVSRSSRPFLYANGFFLLSITFIPFPTAMLAEYIATDYAMPAVVFYCFNGVLNGLTWNLLIEATLKPKLLVNEGKDLTVMKNLRRPVRFGLLIYTATAILAFWLPITALMINFSLWILWISISLTEKVD